MRFTKGSNYSIFYFIPTIVLEKRCEVRYFTVEWLKWFVGFTWDVPIKT